ncbi:rod shape-determining protein MreC [Paenibacillus sophorae]|uniref:Cell shape-determining protein MreC n=1 Tax=Paenibacillus sophorae TaxID=1333845 RepID=A0A1H8QKP7_9BACL|nr:rod shape-determining protein MreC [Paenibacillus sophorae]QWU15090.1 rod shape-determining protein MreC [Paenibacillus sophorae]SEO54752.1 rod shape-determining protein MreC [Paenibacillus sophorae]
MLKLFKLFSNKRLFILLITLVLFIVVMGISLGTRKSLSWPENFVRDTTGFVQNVFYKPAGYIAGFFEDIGNLKNLAEENERLKITVAQYTREKVQYNILAARVAEYEKLLRFTRSQSNKYNYEYHYAQVISLTTEPSNNTLVIDLGARDGVKPNMSVISEKGLVGIISQVSNFTSTVKLLTMMDSSDPNSQPPIAATAFGKINQTFGMVERYDQQTQRLIMTRIDEKDPMAVNDMIISSGIGGLYPQGLIIGTVESVGVGEFGLTKTAVIKPAAGFEDWKSLLVVFTPQEEQ